MKGKNGNLIMILRTGDSIELDGPGTVVVKKTGKNRVAVLINAHDETNINRNASKDGRSRQKREGAALDSGLSLAITEDS